MIRKKQIDKTMQSIVILGGLKTIYTAIIPIIRIPAYIFRLLQIFTISYTYFLCIFWRTINILVFIFMYYKSVCNLYGWAEDLPRCKSQGVAIYGHSSINQTTNLVLLILSLYCEIVILCLRQLGQHCVIVNQYWRHLCVLNLCVLWNKPQTSLP
jgi:hypothetical protein